jgi:hypothetical protein
LISALARTEELATALVPIVVIPQIILAGVIAPLDGSRVARWIAKGFVTVHWAQEALERTLPKNDLSLIEKANENWLGPLAVVVMHLVIAAILGLIVLWQSEEKAQ